MNQSRAVLKLRERVNPVSPATLKCGSPEVTTTVQYMVQSETVE